MWAISITRLIQIFLPVMILILSLFGKESRGLVEQLAQMGYKWIVGNGQSIRLWEDHWFGNSSLAIQFWEIYFICNQQSARLCDVWDGPTIRLSFRSL